MKKSIKNLIAENPQGLLELKPAMTLPEYRRNDGFNLRKAFIIYKSKKIRYPERDWFSFSDKSLKNLVSVKEESESDSLMVFVVETIKDDKIHCNLLLSNKAYQGILNDKKQFVLRIYQMKSDCISENINYQLR